MALFDKVSEEVNEMFDVFSIAEREHTILFFRNTFRKGEKDENEKISIGYRIDRSYSEEEMEYLILVAKMHGINVEFCPRCLIKNTQRVLGRRSFQCLSCGHQFYPTANTIFHKTTVPLKHWFIIIKNMAFRNFSIKDIERNFKMCYKTAHRIYHLIRRSSFYEKLQTLESTIQYNLVKKEIEVKIQTQLPQWEDYFKKSTSKFVDKIITMVD